ncbi:fructose-bisphosphatase class I [Natronococcus pandeyae]|uniref:Fructose-1,6-bisphosphatase class 1 n=1 Tax=Natronococcus pandeyae TaxID=2055836 RepID=A0A8J8TR18_9EURY|nr:class 1 fructose-bisphosphatase [Natronococcus pandeyae]TYL39083.1 fructose-bisphosphatase class I [Natronococcus pandeyae]
MNRVHSRGEYERILDAVADVATGVPAALPDLRRDPEADDDERNPTGDGQSVADRWLDDRFREAIEPLEAVGEYASEERADVLDCGSGYGVAIDPLDGSSNLASNGPIGTVLGIYDAPLPARGTDLVASAIVVFGPCITMTIAADGDAVQYRLEDGERINPRSLSLESDAGGTEGVKDDSVCGFSGPRSDLPSALLEAFDEFRTERRLRYCGAAVADVGAVLEYGGVLCYSETERRPDGVLRLQYEANPIAHVIEAAGGRAIDGSGRILEREPTELHERVPVFVGSAEPIDRIERVFGTSG